MKLNNSNQIIIIFLLTCLLILGCNSLKRIKNKKISYCYLHSNFDGSGRYSYSMIYNSKKYVNTAYGIHGGIENDDKYVAMIDTTDPGNFHALFFMPILESLESYDTTFATVQTNGPHYIPLYNESYHDITVAFKYEDELGNLGTVIRGQILRKDKRTNFIEILKVGDSIPIIYKIGNPHKCFIKIDNYYITDPSQYKE